jgi:hypothetical protein
VPAPVGQDVGVVQLPRDGEYLRVLEKDPEGAFEVAAHRRELLGEFHRVVPNASQGSFAPKSCNAKYHWRSAFEACLRNDLSPYWCAIVSPPMAVGILTNGRHWRLYEQDRSRGGVYFQVDLEAILQHQALRQHARFLPSTRRIWSQLCDLFQIIDQGFEQDGRWVILAYNGGLFSPEKHPHIA